LGGRSATTTQASQPKTDPTSRFCAGAFLIADLGGGHSPAAHHPLQGHRVGAVESATDDRSLAIHVVAGRDRGAPSAQDGEADCGCPVLFVLRVM
jgi:hypothetical protein